MRMVHILGERLGAVSGIVKAGSDGGTSTGAFNLGRESTSDCCDLAGRASGSHCWLLFERFLDQRGGR
jgi:hypothetical protein